MDPSDIESLIRRFINPNRREGPIGRLLADLDRINQVANWIIVCSAAIVGVVGATAQAFPEFSVFSLAVIFVFTALGMLAAILKARFEKPISSLHNLWNKANEDALLLYRQRIVDQFALSHSTKLVQEAHQRELEQMRGPLQEDLQKIKSELEVTRSSLNRMAALYATHKLVWEYVDTAINVVNGQEGHQPDQIDNVFYSLLDSIRLGLDELYEKIEGEQWNFAIYIYSVDEELLVCRACRRAGLADRQDGHRRWRVGEGHVGWTYQSFLRDFGQPLAERDPYAIIDDVKVGDKYKLFDGKHDNYRSYDRDKYVNIISIPIVVGENAQPIGVMLATSDIPGRFATDNIEILRDCAEAAGALLSAANRLQPTFAPAELG